MKQIDLKNDSLGKLMSHYVLASIISMVISAVHQTIDTIFIGQGVGSSGLAAVNIVMPALSWAWALVILFATGGSTLYAIELGKKNFGNARNFFYVTIFITLAFDLALMIFGLLFLEKICLFLGCTRQALPYALPYLKVQIYFMPCISCAAILSRFVRNDGNPQLIGYATGIAALCNIALNYVFIFVFDFGMFGASLATGIAQTLCGLVLLSHFLRKNRTLDLKFINVSFSFKRLLHISKTGFPAFISEGAFAFTLVFINRAVRELTGTNGIASVGIMFTLVNFLYLIIYGVAAASQPIISYNHGASNYERVWKTLKIAIATAGVLGLIATLAGIRYTEILVRMINNTDENLIVLATKVTRINFITMPITAISTCVQTYYQSTDRAALATVLTLLRNSVFVLISLYILKGLFGLSGVWFTYPASDLLSTLIYTICLFKIRTQCAQRIKEEKELETAL